MSLLPKDPNSLLIHALLLVNTVCVTFNTSNRHSEGVSTVGGRYICDPRRMSRKIGLRIS
jgi:hypothetical protein